MIFTLHYDGAKSEQIDEALVQKGASEQQRSLISKILEFGGKEKRGPEDIFFNKN